MARLAPLLPLSALIALCACTGEKPVKDERRAVSVQQITDAASPGTITYAGDIRSAYESQLGFQVAGRIISRSVEPGDTVRAGQALFRIDGSDYARAVDSAAAQTGAAQSAAATQAADLARSRALLKQGFISQAEYDQQKAATDQAQAQLRAARAQGGTSSAQLGRTVLTAPRAGVVTKVEGEVGQVVGAGQAVVTLADPARPEIAVALPEGGLVAVRSARSFTVKLWSDPTRRYAATLRSIAGAADPVTRTFAAKFAITAPAGELHIGETAELAVETDRARGGVLVPLTAIMDVKGRAQAWVLDRATMTVQPRAVKVGPAHGDSLAILAGLKPGDTIVTAGIHLLRAGETVRIAEVPRS